MKKLPSDLKKGQLYVDEKNFTILVPINQEQFVPFHIATVNNVSKSGEGQWTYLRINFQTPPIGKSGSLLFPDHTDPNAVFIKELTLKNKDKRGENNHLRLAEKKIKDLIKKAKVLDQEEDEKKDVENFLQQLQMI
jgi:nucleosome binding factor SPN SPT16 subunit